MKRVVKVGVDRDTCLGHWCCVHVAPRVFPDIGELWPVPPDNVRTFLDADRDKVIQAIFECPVGALWLEFEDGRIVSGRDYDDNAGVQQWLNY